MYKAGLGLALAATLAASGAHGFELTSPDIAPAQCAVLLQVTAR